MAKKGQLTPKQQALLKLYPVNEWDLFPITTDAKETFKQVQYLFEVKGDKVRRLTNSELIQKRQ